MTDFTPSPETLAEYGPRPVPPEWKALNQCWRQVYGIFVGGCVERGVGSSFRSRAHAHTIGANEGWICVRSHRRIYAQVRNEAGRFVPSPANLPSRIMWHELAHVVTGHGHDDVWRRMMRDLGQPIPARYQKRKRKPA